MTFFEAAGQGEAFLLLLCAGAAAGVLLDGATLARRHCPRAVRWLPDLLCGLLIAALCLLALALREENSLRFYALLGILCGIGLYTLGVRRVLLAIVHFFHRLSSSGNTDKKTTAP